MSMILLGIEFAFPSVGWPWNAVVWWLASAPEWLVSALFAFVHESVAEVVVAGGAAGHKVEVSAGTASGALWAIACDPTLREMAVRILSTLGRLMCYADDVAPRAMSCAYLPLCLLRFIFAAAAALRLNAHKTIVQQSCMVRRRGVCHDSVVGPEPEGYL